MTEHKNTKLMEAATKLLDAINLDKDAVSPDVKLRVDVLIMHRMLDVIHILMDMGAHQAALSMLDAFNGYIGRLQEYSITCFQQEKGQEAMKGAKTSMDILQEFINNSKN